MACRLNSAKPLSEPTLEYCSLSLEENRQWHFNQILSICIQENTLENVREMASILLQPECVNKSLLDQDKAILTLHRRDQSISVNGEQTVITRYIFQCIHIRISSKSLYFECIQFHLAIEDMCFIDDQLATMAESNSHSYDGSMIKTWI